MPRHPPCALQRLPPQTLNKHNTPTTPTPPTTTQHTRRNEQHKPSKGHIHQAPRQHEEKQKPLTRQSTSKEQPAHTHPPPHTHTPPTTHHPHHTHASRNHVTDHARAHEANRIRRHNKHYKTTTHHLNGAGRCSRPLSTNQTTRNQPEDTTPTNPPATNPHPTTHNHRYSSCTRREQRPATSRRSPGNGPCLMPQGPTACHDHPHPSTHNPHQHRRTSTNINEQRHRPGRTQTDTHSNVDRFPLESTTTRPGHSPDPNGHMCSLERR